MCCGTIWVCRMENWLATSDVAKVSIAVAGAGRGDADRHRGAVHVSAGCVLIMLNVYATSAAVNGFPSLHLTPDRTVMVSVLPPGTS